MGNMTIDVIAAAAFALEIDAQRDVDNEFSKNVRKLTGSFNFWRRALASKWKERNLNISFCNQTSLSPV